MAEPVTTMRRRRNETPIALLLHPTDTVFGLSGDGSHERAESDRYSRERHLIHSFFPHS
jgi:tRNA A37 threonylcarbamoyladenosine synthetase subunit TsaC/SUA5/YrdC